MKKILILTLALSMTHPGFSVLNRIRSTVNSTGNIIAQKAPKLAKKGLEAGKKELPKVAKKEGPKLAGKVAKKGLNVLKNKLF